MDFLGLYLGASCTNLQQAPQKQLHIRRRTFIMENSRRYVCKPPIPPTLFPPHFSIPIFQIQFYTQLWIGTVLVATMLPQQLPLKKPYKALLCQWKPCHDIAETSTSWHWASALEVDAGAAPAVSPLQDSREAFGEGGKREREGAELERP